MIIFQAYHWTYLINSPLFFGEFTPGFLQIIPVYNIVPHPAKNNKTQIYIKRTIRNCIYCLLGQLDYL